MKIREGFTLTTKYGKCFVSPDENAAKTFNKVIELDLSCKLLFETLLVGSTEEDLVHLLISNYKVTESKARSDVKLFIKILKLNNLLEE